MSSSADEQGPPGAATTGPRRRSLRAGTLWAFAGNAVYAVCQWTAVMVIAKLESAAAVGDFALALAVTGPLYLLCGLSLRSLQAVDQAGEYRFRSFLALRVAGSGVALCLGSVIGLALYGREAAIVVAAVAAWKVAESLGDVYHGAYQAQERLDLVARSLVARGVLAVASMVVLERLFRSVSVSALGMAAALVAVLFAYDIPRRRRLAGPEAGPGTLDGDEVRRLLVRALPLGAVAMIGSLSANVPRFVVEEHLSRELLGIFVAVNYVVIAGTTVIQALGQAASPRLARAFMAGDRVGFWSLLGKMMATAVLLATAMLAVCTFGGEMILSILYRPEYAAWAHLLRWAAVSGAFYFAATLLAYGLTAVAELRVQPVLGLASACATLAGCELLVRGWGLVGAVWGFGIGGAVQVLGQAIVLVTSFPPRGVTTLRISAP